MPLRSKTRTQKVPLRRFKKNVFRTNKQVSSQDSYSQHTKNQRTSKTRKKPERKIKELV